MLRILRSTGDVQAYEFLEFGELEIAAAKCGHYEMRFGEVLLAVRRAVRWQRLSTCHPSPSNVRLYPAQFALISLLILVRVLRARWYVPTFPVG